MKSHTRVWLFFCLDYGWICDFTKMSNFIRESDFDGDDDFIRENNFDGDSDFTSYNCFHRESDFTYYAILLVLAVLMR